MTRKLQNWVAEAEKLLEQQHPRHRFNFQYHKTDEAMGSCPYCAARGHETGPGRNKDRFLVFEDGNFWCRNCKTGGWWSEDRPSQAEMEAKRLVENQKRVHLQSTIATCQDWQKYHQSLDEATVAMWQAFGIDQTDIKRWGLGFCSQAPCTEYLSSSLTIPVFHKQKLVDIRHRLLNPQGGEKYRSHLPGLPPAFLNLDAMKDDGTVFLVEGEKKTIVLEHYGLHPVVSYPGVNSGKALSHILAQEGTKSQQYLFLPDPGTENLLLPVWKELAKEFRVGVVDLIRKPDDFVLEFGVDALQNALVYPRWM